MAYKHIESLARVTRVHDFRDCTYHRSQQPKGDTPLADYRVDFGNHEVVWLCKACIEEAEERVAVTIQTGDTAGVPSNSSG